jgi:hypothetical protein
MKTVRDFLLGVWEFRHSVTTHPSNIYAYDWGRELAHRFTLRRFEP